MSKFSDQAKLKLFDPRTIVYKLFSHRFLAVFVIVATSQMILQLWLEGRDYAINNQGSKLLFEILSTSTHPELLGSSIAPPRSLKVRDLQGIYLKSFSTRSLHIDSYLEKRNLPQRNPAESANPQIPPTQPLKNSPGTQSRALVDEKRPSNKSKPIKTSSVSTKTKINEPNKDHHPGQVAIVQRIRSQNSTIPSDILAKSGLNPEAASGSAIFILDGQLINLSAKCVIALSQPLRTIDRNHRTDVAMMVFQLWLWGLTIRGLFLESVPHLLAVGASHILNIAFSALDLHETIHLHDFFHKVVAEDCDGVDVIPLFWGSILRINIVSLIFATFTFVTLSALGYKLYSVLDWRTFKKLGASRIVRIAHTFSLIFMAILHLSVYFIVIFLAIWLDELRTHSWTESENDMRQSTQIFKTLIYVFLPMTILWLFLGNWSLSRENVYGVTIFAIFDIVLICFHLLLLTGGFYKRMIKDWIFLKFSGIMAMTLLFAGLLVAVGCMLFFEKGLLARAYLDSQELAQALERPSVCEEKVEVAFPKSVDPISFSSSYPRASDEKRNLQLSSEIERANQQPDAFHGLQNSAYNHRASEVSRTDSSFYASEVSRQNSWTAGDERWAPIAPETHRR
ncbi:expressed protein [Phakopsora pachyrhizi]|uniref:Expressed protein n=1 Tax=Phakopsora pachyrhizi TaxID=170000 RepID=A0AAV0B8W6_PHAPC|nr:expressed protein [Phakopsora pachyrhizi]